MFARSVTGRRHLLDTRTRSHCRRSVSRSARSRSRAPHGRRRPFPRLRPTPYSPPSARCVTSSRSRCDRTRWACPITTAFATTSSRSSPHSASRRSCSRPRRSAPAIRKRGASRTFSAWLPGGARRRTRQGRAAHGALRRRRSRTRGVRRRRRHRPRCSRRFARCERASSRSRTTSSSCSPTAKRPDFSAPPRSCASIRGRRTSPSS